MENKNCEHCGSELFERGDRYCSGYCEGMALHDRDDLQFKKSSDELVKS